MGLLLTFLYLIEVLQPFKVELTLTKYQANLCPNKRQEVLKLEELIDINIWTRCDMESSYETKALTKVP